MNHEKKCARTQRRGDGQKVVIFLIVLLQTCINGYSGAIKSKKRQPKLEITIKHNCFHCVRFFCIRHSFANGNLFSFDHFFCVYKPIQFDISLGNGFIYIEYWMVASFFPSNHFASVSLFLFRMSPEIRIEQDHFVRYSFKITIHL